MSEISVRALEPHTYAVHLTEGTLATDHRIVVDDDTLDVLGMPDLDEQLLVEQTAAFLLEREPATAILSDFSLADVSRSFADYLTEIRVRVGG